MKSKLFRLFVVAIALIGVSVVGAPSTSQAVIITDVVVHVGPAGPAGNQWCGTAGCSGEVAAGTFVIWSFPVGGINLGTSSTLLLSQTGGAFNFDTSDFCIGAGSCVPLATIKIFTDQGTFTFTENAARNLSFPAADTLDNPPLETREFASGIGASAFVSLLVGYADSAHLQSSHPACATTGPGSDGTGGNPINCFPDPFSATFVQASAAGPTGCLGSINPCFDAGVIKITALSVSVPEPGTLLLLGSGLLGLAAWGRRRLRS
jgi:hypothetical protein